VARTADRETRRAAIVAAATETFAERGVTRATVSDIVRRAGVAQGTFYLYFPSKEDVLLAVVEGFVGTVVNGIEQAVAASDRSAVEKLLALRDGLSAAAVDPAAPELIEIMHRKENQALHDRLADYLVPRLIALVEDVVRQGVAEGAFDVPDIRAAAWFVLGGLQSAELSGASPAELPAALAAATDLALRALGSPLGAPPANRLDTAWRPQ
jgi:AcrR family transcriptional regulator